jgi:hypothetical protein
LKGNWKTPQQQGKLNDKLQLDKPHQLHCEEEEKIKIDKKSL